MTSSTQRTTSVSDGTTLHVETHGTSIPSLPSLVFLHYYGGSPATWSQVLRDYRLKPFHKILYHARGWAPSTGPDDSKFYGIEAMSSDLAAVIAATGLDQHDAGFILIGHSMGAKVAQHYAANTRPSNLKGLLLVAPAPLYGLQLPDQAKEQQRSAYQTREAVEYVLNSVLLARPGMLSAETTEQCIQDSLRGNQHAKDAWPNYAMAEDFGELVNRIKIPVLVLRGDGDFERNMVGALGVEQGWTNKTVEECGHLVPLEQPRTLANELIQFVERMRCI
ncbi:MAG: hypothetical protein Q9159_001572 [Coniocarpon cinnabarinum]